MRSYKTRASSPVVAILWENWRLTYLAFFVSLFLGAGVTHGLAEMERLKNFPEVDPWMFSYAICYFSLFLYGAVLLFSLADPKDLNMRIPARHYSLPMRTERLVLVHMGYRLVTFCVLAVALLIVMRVEFGELLERGFASDLCIVLLLFSYAQAFAWTFGNVKPIWTAATLAGLPVAGVALFKLWSKAEALRQLSAVSQERLQNVVAGSRGSSFSESVQLSFVVGEQLIAILVVLAFLYLLIAYAGAVHGRTRKGVMGDRLGVAGLWLRRDLQITPSSVQAQRWYEWRRKGLVLPGITAGLVLLLLVISCLIGFADFDAGDLSEMLLFLPVYVSPIAAFFAGLYYLSVDYRHASSGLATFLFTRPLSTEHLVQARLRMSILSVLLNAALCLGIIALGVVIGAVSRSHTVDLLPATLDISDVVLGAALVVGHSLMVWSILWMCVPVLVYLLWFGSFFYYQSLVSNGFGPGTEMTQLIWLVWIPTALLAVVAFLVWRNPATGRSLTGPVHSIIRSVVALTLLVFIAIAWSEDFLDEVLTSFEAATLLVALIGLSLLPIMSITAQPLVLERLRRR